VSLLLRMHSGAISCRRQPDPARWFSLPRSARGTVRNALWIACSEARVLQGTETNLLCASPCKFQPFSSHQFSRAQTPSPLPPYFFVCLTPSGFCSNLIFGTSTFGIEFTLPSFQVHGTYSVSRTRMTAPSYTLALQDQLLLQTNQSHLSVYVRCRHTI
jgi:hypothetical protein